MARTSLGKYESISAVILGLEELLKSKGALESDPSLKTQIEKILAENGIEVDVEKIKLSELLEEVRSIDLGAERVLEKAIDFENSKVPVGKIRELVADYENYLENGLSQEEAFKKLTAANKNIPQNLVEEFIERQTKIFETSRDKNFSKEVAAEELRIKRDLQIQNLSEDQTKRIIESTQETTLKAVKGEISRAEAKKSIEKISEEVRSVNSSELAAKLNESTERIITASQVRSEIDRSNEHFLNSLKKSNEGLAEAISRNESQIRSVTEKAISNAFENDTAYPGVNYETLKGEIENVLGENGVPVSQETSIKIATEVKSLSISNQKWIEQSGDLVAEFRGDTAVNRIEAAIFDKGGVLSEVQQEAVSEYGQIIKEVYFKGVSLETYKSGAVLAAEKNGSSPGEIVNAWTETRGMAHILKMDENRFRGILQRYGVIKEKLRGLIPYEINESRSWENISNTFRNPGYLNNLVSFYQKFDRLKNTSADFLNSKGIGVGKINESIGVQNIKSFIDNTLSVFSRKGMSEGINYVLRGTAGGESSGNNIFAGLKNAGGSAINNGLRNLLGGIGRGAGNFLRNNLGNLLGKGMGGAIGGLSNLIGGLSSAASMAQFTSIIPIIVVGVFLLIFISGMSNGTMVSSLTMPPEIGSPGEEYINFPTPDPNRVIPEGCPAIWPVLTGRITQGPDCKGSSHDGKEAIDIGLNNGSDLFATHDGIAYSGSDNRSGNYVVITGTCQGSTFYSVYAHLESTLIHGETEVKMGQKIGFTDDTGNSTGPHLHYAFRNLSDINLYLPNAAPRGCCSASSCQTSIP